jgi:hypothetical protein
MQRAAVWAGARAGLRALETRLRAFLGTVPRFLGRPVPGLYIYIAAGNIDPF